MNKDFVKCLYHPDKKADFICERCQNPICNDDLRIYSKFNLQKFYNKEGSTYYTSHNYCILCNASQLKSDINPKKFLFFVPFLLIFSFFFSFLLVFLTGISPLLTIVIIFVIFIALVIVSTIFSFDQAQIAAAEAKKFKSTLNSDSNDSLKDNFNSLNSDHVEQLYNNNNNNNNAQEKNNELIPFNLSSNVCFKCGSNISSNDMFCQNCGELVSDDHLNLN